ncbi:uncharacterized protein RAG0_10712 [Rhynchosporium agropyri]|uniref:Uncharacterized protein n=1 Tax=Rhynchosporium agropyri TaxID=914238 RepID=A0A1E1L0W3_9HELO|nr:uncharacterized protein RAG0_10712 [Rhynchosporium agropyri]
MENHVYAQLDSCVEQNITSDVTLIDKLYLRTSLFRPAKLESVRSSKRAKFVSDIARPVPSNAAPVHIRQSDFKQDRSLTKVPGDFVQPGLLSQSKSKEQFMNSERKSALSRCKNGFGSIGNEAFHS